MLLRTAIAEGVEYVDLEDDIAHKVRRFGSTKRIISFHDFRKTPENLGEIHRRLCELDPDIVKLCTMANHPHDNLRMLQLTRQSKVPTIGICMGDIGLPTRILAGRFGAPLSYATFHHERVLAPGQLSFHDMTEVYHYDQITADTEVYGVVADPVGHSLGPLIHNAAFHAELEQGLCSFSRAARGPVSVSSTTRRPWACAGLSVTTPHKEEVVKKLTESDVDVHGIGATNTIMFQDQRRLGFNTDSQAAMASLLQALEASGAGPADTTLRGKIALVLGAGGVGMAIAYGLLRHGVQVVVADGVPRQAILLAKRLNCRSVDWSLRHTVTPDLLFNCTPVGMHPNVDETPFEKHHLRPSMVVFDAVYNPENTLLIKEARSRNCKVVTGVDMFVRQACLQFKLFTGQDGPAELMREVVKRAIGAARY